MIVPFLACMQRRYTMVKQAFLFKMFDSHGVVVVEGCHCNYSHKHKELSVPYYMEDAWLSHLFGNCTWCMNCSGSAVLHPLARFRHNAKSWFALAIIKNQCCGLSFQTYNQQTFEAGCLLSFHICSGVTSWVHKFALVPTVHQLFEVAQWP